MTDSMFVSISTTDGEVRMGMTRANLQGLVDWFATGKGRTYTVTGWDQTSDEPWFLMVARAHLTTILATEGP